jgi:hypothetical protein
MLTSVLDYEGVGGSPFVGSQDRLQRTLKQLIRSRLPQTRRLIRCGADNYKYRRRRAGACNGGCMAPAEAAWPHGGCMEDGGRRTICGGGRRRRTADCDGLEPCITVDACVDTLSLNLTPY